MFKDHENRYILDGLDGGMFSGTYHDGTYANVTLVEHKLSFVIFTEKEVHEVVEDVSGNLKQDEGKAASKS